MANVGVLKLGYNGKDFHGFARQDGLRTVQGELEQALEVFFHTQIDTVCAGRTDAGVHALGQQISFSLEGLTLPENAEIRIVRAMNALTSPDISVSSFRVENEGFSCRFSAKEREYRYRIVTDDVPPLFLKDFAYHLKVANLDIDAMRCASTYLIGEHDFASFCMTQSAIDKNTVRELISIELVEGECLGEHYLEIRVIGNAFLHNMIRILIGTLLEVGLNRKNPEWVKEVLDMHDRRFAGNTAPACGLTFYEVRY